MTKVTDDWLLGDYITCESKAFLGIAKQEGESNAVHEWHLERSAEYKETICARLTKLGQMQCDTALTTGSGGIGYYPGVLASYGYLNFRIDAVQKYQRDAKSILELIPVAFHYGEKITRLEKLQIAAQAVALGRQFDTAIPQAKIIHGNNYSQTFVSLATFSAEAERILQEVGSLKRQTTPPKTALNAHCNACVYSRLCREQAKERDCLTLLPRLSPREISSLEARGITTIAQYSYTYRPPKRRSRPAKPKHNLALQAIALRTGKIYVTKEDLAPHSQAGLYFDVECDPDRDFYYLVGVLDTTGVEPRCDQFWANDESEESKIWLQLLSLVTERKSCPIYHYGDFERRYVRRMVRRYGGDGAEVERLQSNLVNVLSSVYSQIYFPVYSNSLKEIATYLGFQWTEKGSGGAISIVWRKRWEQNPTREGMQRLLTYNYDDCSALRLVVSSIELLARGGSGRVVDVASLIPLVSRQYGEVDFVLPDLHVINKAAYFDYQRRKVQVRTSPLVRKALIREARNGVLEGRPNKEINIVALAACPHCTTQRPYTHRYLSKTVYDLKRTRSGIKKWIVKHNYADFRCRACGKISTNLKGIDRPHSKYGSGFIGWCVYKNIGLRQSHGEIVEEARELFGLSVRRALSSSFKKVTAQRLGPLYDRLLAELVKGPVIYADETTVKYVGGSGYVWVFSTADSILYVYRPTREGEFLKKMLGDFKGVLVSDFYAAYDSLPCSQQKCLVHLIRDINDDLHKNPLDDSLHDLAQRFTAVLRPIVKTIDTYGLKKRYLRKHRHDVELFFGDLSMSPQESDVAAAFRGRLRKNQSKLFEFLNHDGVAWNNNIAENGVKRFAFLRRVILGSSTEEGIGEYLTLLSLSETLKRRGQCVSEFFMSDGREAEILGIKD
ncbi:IS66 family transposase [Paracoccus actinidiae]|uniref:IS66 family transposase n=1 Tax=Paracoccus actinidiae TaxID=3064531 RepID=UPI0027D2035C|nr:IS66 family transposase [Paracoccus sp. M09]